MFMIIQQVILIKGDLKDKTAIEHLKEALPKNLPISSIILNEKFKLNSSIDKYINKLYINIKHICIIRIS